MDDEAQSLLQRYKTSSFRATDLPYREAVESLDTESPALEAVQVSPSEWTVSAANIV